jgi:L-gulonolactone oxidase
MGLINQLTPELKAIASTDFTFQNWAKTFQCTPELFFTPSTEEEIQKV